MKYILEQIRIFLFGKEKNLAKTIVNWVLIILILAGLIDYGVAHDGDLTGLLKKETWQDKDKKVINDTVYIRSLGNIDHSKLEKASEIIYNKFGVITKITKPLDSNKGVFYPNSYKIDPYTTLKGMNDDNICITITEYEMTNNDKITSVMGVRDKKNMLISTNSPLKETLIHEYGHYLGLNHCEDSHCIMSTFSNGYDVSYGSNFCDKCSSQINVR